MPTMSQKPLPPNGRRYLDSSRFPCPWVAIGPGAWDFSRLKPFPVMVLPPDKDPFGFTWPVAGVSVLLVEWGGFDTHRLELTALALLDAGAELVHTIREALLPVNTGQPYVASPSYVRELNHAAA
jgi:hypothetical protein